MDFTSLLVTGFSVLTILTQIAAVLLIAFLLSSALDRRFPVFLAFAKKHGLWIMFAGAVLATAGSLYFSEVAGWVPCLKCWYQRIFMYPQAVILLVALIQKDRNVTPYVLWLSLIGLAIAGDHYAQQVNAVLNPADPLEPCGVGASQSCAQSPFFHFGYITIPVMAASVFLLNALLSWTMMRKK